MSRTGRVVRNIVGVALGFAAVFLPLLFLSMGNGTVWLPLATGVGEGFLLGMLPRFVAARARWPVGVAVALSMTALYLVSGNTYRLVYGHHYEKPSALAFGLVTLAAIGYSLKRCFDPPKDKRPPWGLMIAIGSLSCLVAYVSSSHGGADWMVQWVIRHFGYSEGKATEIVIVFRKSIHFSFYGLFGLLCWLLAVRAAGRDRAVAFALSMTTVLASFDEIRQSNQVGRTGSFWDVLLDLAGAAVFVLVVNRRAQKTTTSVSSRRKSTTMRT